MCECLVATKKLGGEVLAGQPQQLSVPQNIGTTTSLMCCLVPHLYVTSLHGHVQHFTNYISNPLRCRT